MEARQGTYRLGIPVRLDLVMHLCEGGCGSGGGWLHQRSVAGVARGVWGAGRVVGCAVVAWTRQYGRVAGGSIQTTRGRTGVRLWRWWWWRGPLGRRSGDHELETLLRRGQLRDVVFGVGATDVLLHGAVTLFLKAGGDVTTGVLAKAMGGASAGVGV